MSYVFSQEFISDFANMEKIPMLIREYSVEDVENTIVNNIHQFDITYFKKDVERIKDFLHQYCPMGIFVNHFVIDDQIEYTQQKLIELTYQ